VEQPTRTWPHVGASVLATELNMLNPHAVGVRGETGNDDRGAPRFTGEYAPGTTIPGTQFKISQVLGRGGHATVYDVENAIGKRLVVKVIHSHLAARGDFTQRIEEEARTLVQLEHPNIVTVYDLGLTNEEHPRPFIVMERLNGKNGREILQEVGRLEVRHALDIGIDVCAALAVAHAKKVVHQDIKPDNIFIHIGIDGRPITKLVDFGILRMLDRPQDKGIFEGTVLYAAPEQLRFEGVSAKTDLYAVGLLLFELITGVRPFPDLDDAPSASAAVKMRLAHIANPAPALSQWMLVPGELESLVQQCLASSPDARPESAARLADSFRGLRRKIQAAPKEVQLRTEATLLGAVAEVRAAAPRPPVGGATATFAPPDVAGGRFGQANNADARIAQGVLTSERVQSGATARIPMVRPEGRGRFADAIDGGGADGDRTSDAPTSAPPAVDEFSPPAAVGTLDATVPSTSTSSEEQPRRRGRARMVVAAVTLAGGLFLTIALLVRVFATRDGSPKSAASISAPVAAAQLPAVTPSAAFAPPAPEPTPAPPTDAVPSTPPAAPVASAAPPLVSSPASSHHAAPAAHGPHAAGRAHDVTTDWLESDAPEPKQKPKPKTDPKPNTAPGLEGF
jgi:tRNA A-37 threonylcarbamoyl transferase component Bud32